MLQEQHAEATAASKHAERLWRQFHQSITAVYDEGQCVAVRTTNEQIAGALGVTAQQVSRWRHQAAGRDPVTGIPQLKDGP
jgi:CRP-like cAMP-binding protein